MRFSEAQSIGLAWPVVEASILRMQEKRRVLAPSAAHKLAAMRLGSKLTIYATRYPHVFIEAAALLLPGAKWKASALGNLAWRVERVA